MHIPVLLNEILDLLDLEHGDVVVDGTVGNAGHSQEFAKMIGEKGILVGIDQDNTALEVARENLSQAMCRVELVQDNFRNITSVLQNLEIPCVDAVLLDLGLRSTQLDEGKRGFSFRIDEPLVMTFRDKPLPDDLTAYDVVNTWEEEYLQEIIKGYGEERYARRITRAIIEARKEKPLESTFDLAHVIENAVPAKYRHGRIHPATRTFQAIRMAVNDELGALEDGLKGSWEALCEGGKLAVISFHSIEDRIVKRFFKSLEEATILTKKPVTPTREEIINNKRSRSSKLRVVQKN